VVNGRTIVVAVVVAFVAAVAAYRFWPGDERAIRGQLALVEEMGSKDEAEQPMDGLVRAAQLAALFDDPCQLTVESTRHAGSFSRKQIQDRIVLVRTSFARVRVSLHDIVIDRIDNGTAALHGTLRLSGQGTGDPVADVQEVRVEMARIDGQWLFTAVTLVEVLER